MANSTFTSFSPGIIVGGRRGRIEELVGGRRKGAEGCRLWRDWTGMGEEAEDGEKGVPRSV